MNYRHHFHAGNFADVWKHIVLIALLQALARKEKPYFYFDSHAGSGLYSLQDPQAEKTGEFQQGVGKIWQNATQEPLLNTYQQLVRLYNPHALAHYPGSPSIAQQLMRDHDRAILCELHPEDGELLRRHFAGQSRFTVLQQNGYQTLNAQLPPRERRGLVLLDPPYEKDDFSATLAAVIAAAKRWETGCFAVWYPIKARAAIDSWHRQWVKSGISKIAVAELCVARDDNPLRLNGSGMLIVNPPWQLEDALAPTAQVLLPQLKTDPFAHWRWHWLVEEKSDTRG